MTTTEQSQRVGILVPANTYNPAALEQIVADEIVPALNGTIESGDVTLLKCWNGGNAIEVYFDTKASDDEVKRVMEDLLPDLNWSRGIVA